MIIEENFKTITFKELETGDVFRRDSIYYLKVPTWAAVATGYKYNSYDLVNNNYYYFFDDTTVIPVKAKLVIE